VKSSSNHPTPPNPSLPSDDVMPQASASKGNVPSSKCPKERGHIIQPVGFMPQMKVQVTLCLHDQAFTCQGPAKTNKYALQGSTSHNIMPSKPYLIKEPPKHVHQIPPFQNKQMLKDLIQFAKFRYGRGVIMPYWVNQFLK
jgi:hypothetical protein